MKVCGCEFDEKKKDHFSLHLFLEVAYEIRMAFFQTHGVVGVGVGPLLLED